MSTLVRNGDSGHTVVIASSGTTSSVFDARGGITWGIETPAALTGDEFAIEVSNTADGGFGPLNRVNDDGTVTPVAFTVAANGKYTLPPQLAPWPFFRLVSDETEAAEREIGVVDKG